MPLSTADTAHLLRRAGFGTTGPLVGELQSIGSRAGAVDRLLDTSGLESDGLGALFTVSVDALRRWWLDRMVTSRTPLVEKLTLFWHSHFVSSTDKVPDLTMLYRQNQLLRAGALGSFHDLLQGVAVDPAMLLYLDNATNEASEPQENFGREVLEVFTVGPAGRSEEDVVAMTRAWTGHGLDGFLGSDFGQHYAFHPDKHDNGPKALFGLPARNWDGPAAVSELVLRSRQELTSRFVAAKLFSFLAYPVGPDAPVVHRVAEEFRRSKLSIAALVRAILRSDEFWSAEARGALVRSPVEWVVAALQATGQSATASAPDQHMGLMGQELFSPPTVAGWGQNAYWLSSARMWGRASFAQQLRHTAPDFLAATTGMSAADAARHAFLRLGVPDPSAASRRAAETFVQRARDAGHGGDVPAHLLPVVLLSPDFQVA